MKKLIDLHKECLKTGKLPDLGLCHSIPTEYIELLELFNPTWEEKEELEETGYCRVYWASGLPNDHKDECYTYTPLRQAIVLLICAMVDEL